MAARIPQMYSTPRAHPQQAPPYAQQGNPFSSSTDSLGGPVQAHANHDSANLSSIGGLLLSGSSFQDEKAAGRARTGSFSDPERQQQHYVEVNRAELHARVKSLEAAVGEHEHTDDESDYGAVPPHAATAPLTPRNRQQQFPNPQQFSSPQQFPSPHAQQFPNPQPVHHHGHVQQQQQQQQRAAPVIVDFPNPNMGMGGQGGFPPTPDTPSRQSPGPFAGRGHENRPSIKIQLPVMSNAAPVSPMLAAPPRAHFAMGASDMTPPSSPSVRAFDAIKEKKATFREDDTEVFSPFSPHARQAGPRAPRGNRVSTVDFWKRLSTMNKMDNRQDSDFIKKKKRSIWVNPYFVFPLIFTLVGTAVIIVVVVIKVHNTTSAGNAVE